MKKMTMMTLSLAAALLCGGAFAAPQKAAPQKAASRKAEPHLRDGWLATPVPEPAGKKVDIDNPIPESAGTSIGLKDLKGQIPQVKDAAKGTSMTGVFNCWYTKTVDVPADWKGKSVRLEIELAWCDIVIYVNGKKAGVAYDPDGSVEVSHLLKYGAANEIKLFATNRGWGTGEHGVRYWGRGDLPPHQFNAPHFRSNFKFVVRSGVFVDDVYAQPSWRGTEVGSGEWDGNKKLTVHVDVEAVAAAKADILVEIFDDVGKGKAPATPGEKVVKSAKKTVSVKKGASTVAIDIPWPDVTCWEPVPNAKCYVCKVTMSVGGEPCTVRVAPFLFGFREVWRQGKEIVLNGHLQRFRGFWNQGQPKVASDVHRYGYNLSFETHRHWAVCDENVNNKNEQARAGIAVFAGMPSIYFVHDEIRKDPDCTAQWRRFLKRYMRRARNMPSIVAMSCGVNQICPERNMRPEILGQDPEKGGVVDNIEFARLEARKFHPNCLYFSHADGTEADLSTSNLYFNFTPLQEREEWLSSWAENGTLPWAPVEFGAPYYACWFHSRTPQMTEWLAVYYGEKAYAEEKPEMLYHTKAYSKDCLAKIHGGWVNGGDMLYVYNPLGRVFSRNLVYRTNRAWRTYGQNGGMMYLEAWPWDKPNETLDRQKQANGDLVTWLAGADEITDRTHAFRSGETIARQLVAVWDGVGEKTVKASWKFVAKDGGKVLASGVETFALKQGDIQKKTISVKAPSVKKITDYRFEVAFESDVDRAYDQTFATVEKDSFDVEVYPAAVRRVKGTVAAFDPSGDSVKMLEALGLTVKPYPTLEAALADASVTRLVVGRRALGKACGLEKAAPRIAAGLKVLVLPQEADVWQIMGFTVEDMMPREMRNVSLPGIRDTALAHWRGFPKWEKDYGLVMKHNTRRGPRWKHTHAVAGLALLIPQRAGVLPLVRGEFDMSYSTLLKIASGKGSATMCTFDFEERVGKDGCPAATETAAAMMEDFLADDKTLTMKVYVDGGEAARLAKTLGLDAETFAGAKVDRALVIAGRDAKSDYKTLRKALGKGSRAYVFANTNLAAQAGFGLERVQTKVNPSKKKEITTDVLVVRDRAGWENFPFAGVGPQHLRFRDKLMAFRYLPTGGGFKTTGDGLFATDGTVLFDAIDPYQICDRYRQGKDGRAAVVKASGWGKTPAGERDLYLRTTAQTEDNQMRRLSLVFANMGAGAGKAILARSLYTKPVQQYEPLAQYNVLGPWPSKNDDSNYMINTTDFPVEPGSDNKGSVAEEMAIRGDVQPNPRFRPLGLTYLDSTPEDLRFLDWRPVVKPDADGKTDLRKLELVASQSFNTCYCVGFLERETDGEITLRFGVDWRGAVWVNGKEVIRTMGGTKDEGSIVKTGIKVWAMPKGKTPAEIHALDKERGTFDGKNVITVKAGSGQSASTFYLRVSKEEKPGDVKRVQVKELDGVDLYETANPDFDPYEYVYW